jgi:transcriptional regulator with XRE-family HTH domain
MVAELVNTNDSFTGKKNQLKKLRLEKGISVKDIVQKLNISIANYYHMESGKRKIKAQYHKKLAEIFGVELEEMKRIVATVPDLNFLQLSWLANMKIGKHTFAHILATRHKRERATKVKKEEFIHNIHMTVLFHLKDAIDQELQDRPELLRYFAKVTNVKIIKSDEG